MTPYYRVTINEVVPPAIIPSGYFADSSRITPLAFEGKGSLPRNAPSLVNAAFNHLMMLDGGN